MRRQVSSIPGIPVVEDRKWNRKLQIHLIRSDTGSQLSKPSQRRDTALSGISQPVSGPVLDQPFKRLPQNDRPEFKFAFMQPNLWRKSSSAMFIEGGDCVFSCSLDFMNINQPCYNCCYANDPQNVHHHSLREKTPQTSLSQFVSSYWIHARGLWEVCVD